jgi:hypothetical protein
MQPGVAYEPGDDMKSLPELRRFIENLMFW